MEMVLGDGGGSGGAGVRNGGGRSPGGGLRNHRADKTDSFNGCGRAGSTRYNGAAVDIDCVSLPRSRERLARVYSFDDVTRAMMSASKHRAMGCCYHRDHEEVDRMWGVFLVLTSDAAWGASRVNRLGKAVKSSARAFMHDLLRYTCGSRELSDHYTVANFMNQYVHRMQHPAFARLLRGVIMAFPMSLEQVGKASDVNHEYLTALQMAADDHRVPQAVLKVLLEGGACVDHSSDNGDTPLMLACYIGEASGCDGKAEVLLDYGARIDAYNMQLQNVLHLAAESENCAAMETLLRVRELRGGANSAAALHPDPLHMPDLFHKTPLTSVCMNQNVHYKDRVAMADMLVEAGAGADEDIDQQTRRAAEACDAPMAYGIITYHQLDPNTVYATVRKAGYCFDMEVNLEVLLIFVDEEASVLPGPESPMFSLEWLFMSCKKQRFCFRPDLGGMDFDIHFDLGEDGSERVRSTPSWQTQFMVCVRLPKGPCPLSAWTDEFVLEDTAYLEGNFYPDRGYTLAHHAVACVDADTRIRVAHLAEGLCNPLKRCSEGRTAADMLADFALQYAARAAAATPAVPWSLARLLKRMRKREDTMRQYIHRDALLLADGAVGTASEQEQAVQQRDNKRKRCPAAEAAQDAPAAKAACAADTTKAGSQKRGKGQAQNNKSATAAGSKRPTVSPFAALSDDVCRLILSFV